MVALFLSFGLLTIFSVGLAFLVLGATLIVLSAFRSRPRVFWSGLGLVLGFLAGYAIVAPAWCMATPIPAEEPASTGLVVCRSLAGVTYEGPSGYSPSLWPGLAAGGVGAILGGVVAWITIPRQGAASLPHH